MSIHPVHLVLFVGALASVLIAGSDHEEGLSFHRNRKGKNSTLDSSSTSKDRSRQRASKTQRPATSPDHSPEKALDQSWGSPLAAGCHDSSTLTDFSPSVTSA